MPLTIEQQKHLEATWQNIQMRSNDDSVLKQNELLGVARAKNNRAAIPIAYSEAALHRLETTVRNQLDWTVCELEAMGIILDDQAERFILKHFNIMTSMDMPVHYPPGLTATMNLSAHQSAHAQARQRMNNQLQREAAAAIKSLKLKARPSQPVYAVNIQNNNSPGARSYIHSVDDSVTYTHVPKEISTLMETLSGGHSDLATLAEQVHRAPDTSSMAERATKWLTVASSVETLAEKLHAAAPTISAWIHRITS